MTGVGSLVAAFVHALVVPDPLAPSLQAVRALHLTDLAILSADDLRHPGWARPEPGRAGHPSLPDPRIHRKLVEPVPMRATSP